MFYSISILNIHFGNLANGEFAIFVFIGWSKKLKLIDTFGKDLNINKFITIYDHNHNLIHTFKKAV